MTERPRVRLDDVRTAIVDAYTALADDRAWARNTDLADLADLEAEFDTLLGGYRAAYVALNGPGGETRFDEIDASIAAAWSNA